SRANSTVFVIADAGEEEAAKVTELGEQVSAVAGIKSTQPPQYIGGDRWQINAFPEGQRYSDTATDAVEATRTLDTELTVWVGGETAVFVDQRAAIIERVPLALLLIGLITFIVLFLMTGSVVLPIKTFIMNVFTLAATFGILTFVFGQDRLEGLLDYNGQGALEMTQPVLLFALAFGLATDYGVFLLGRIKEVHDQGTESNEAVALGVARTGRVITSAALLFCVAIGAFSLSSIVFIKELGIGTALAVAIDATIIRALLVPALMVLLGDYNWWAPRWMKRLHARIGLSEGPSAPAPAATG
ncbi:MAG: MMPL family transporter, partial [Solirubrobacterales bacterium]